jgi:uncharacterized coiled-coil protein SlyX
MVGFALVAMEIGRVQRREFGTPRFIERLRGRLRRLFRRTKTVEGSAHSVIHTSGSARGVVRTGRGSTLEDHVAALEENFGRLDDEVAANRVETERWRSELLEQLTVTRAEFNEQRQRDDEDRKGFLRTSLLLQTWGTTCFVVGTVLGVVGGVG